MTDIAKGILWVWCAVGVASLIAGVLAIAFVVCTWTGLAAVVAITLAGAWMGHWMREDA